MVEIVNLMHSKYPVSTVSNVFFFSLAHFILFLKLNVVSIVFFYIDECWSLVTNYVILGVFSREKWIKNTLM